MTQADIKAEIEFYERRLIDDPEGKLLYEMELKKLRKYVHTKTKE